MTAVSGPAWSDLLTRRPERTGRGVSPAHGISPCPRLLDCWQALAASGWAWHAAGLRPSPTSGSIAAFGRGRELVRVVAAGGPGLSGLTVLGEVTWTADPAPRWANRLLSPALPAGRYLPAGRQWCPAIAEAGGQLPPPGGR